MFIQDLNTAFSRPPELRREIPRRRIRFVNVDVDDACLLQRLELVEDSGLVLRGRT